MKTLTIDDFDDFFRAVMARILNPKCQASDRGPAAFPWQRDLAVKWARGGLSGPDTWTEVVSIPTGLGKTMGVMAAWLWALAVNLQKHGSAQQVPRRLFHVIDRRAVVDQSHDVAEAVRATLESAEPGTGVCRIRDALLLAGSDAPLRLGKMRGGIFQDVTWTEDPSCAAIVSTTVDQLGSALLFRKYLASAAKAPIYAGLASCDALIAVDEAHLSRPFMDMLEAIKKEHANPLRPFVLVSLTATNQQDPTFGLTDGDYQDPVVIRRTQTPKPASVRVVESQADSLKATAEHVNEWIAAGHTRIAVVRNTVNLARRTFNYLRKNGKVEVILLTGRSRPHDRDALVERYKHELTTSDRKATSREAPLVVVCTQCIEVGVDFDFDAMVSDSAPLDSLQQRAGRLARGGHASAPLVVLHVDNNGKSDPVYGDIPAKVVKWMGGLDEIDFCWTGMKRVLSAQVKADLCAKSAPSPTISTDLFDLWVQSNPRPASDPTVSPFLHGYGKGTEVSVVWRADLPDNPKFWAPIIKLVPPSTAEAVTVPASEAVSFLSKSKMSEDTADVPSADGEIPANIERAALIWRGTADKSEVCTDPKKIRPGDVLVVPASYGGHDEFGWTGWLKKVEPVSDIQAIVDCKRFGWDDANASKSRRIRVRLHRNLLSNDAWKHLGALIGRLQEDHHPETLAELIEGARNAPLDEASKKMLEAASPLELRRGWALYPGEEGGGAFTTGVTIDPDDEDADESSRAKEPLALTTHLKDVGRQASKWASFVGLSAEKVALLELGGETHDEGKGVPRFQFQLGRQEDGPKLAKSGSKRPGETAAEKERHRQKTRRAVPVRWRHEFLSVEMMELEPVLRRMEEEGHDVDLVLYLVGTHHGHGRCFAPPCLDTQTGTFEHEISRYGVKVVAPCRYKYRHIDAGWAERFCRVNAAHGRWNVAYLETLLRLADWRASAERANGTLKGDGGEADV